VQTKGREDGGEMATFSLDRVLILSTASSTLPKGRGAAFFTAYLQATLPAAARAKRENTSQCRIDALGKKLVAFDSRAAESKSHDGHAHAH
jgi:uncharacterized protein involved in propanediol utilization